MKPICHCLDVYTIPPNTFLYIRGSSDTMQRLIWTFIVSSCFVAFGLSPAERQKLLIFASILDQRGVSAPLRSEILSNLKMSDISDHNIAELTGLANAVWTTDQLLQRGSNDTDGDGLGLTESLVVSETVYFGDCILRATSLGLCMKIREITTNYLIKSKCEGNNPPAPRPSLASSSSGRSFTNYYSGRSLADYPIQGEAVTTISNDIHENNRHFITINGPTIRVVEKLPGKSATSSKTSVDTSEHPNNTTTNNKTSAAASPATSKLKERGLDKTMDRQKRGSASSSSKTTSTTPVPGKPIPPADNLCDPESYRWTGRSLSSLATPW